MRIISLDISRLIIKMREGRKQDGIQMTIEMRRSQQNLHGIKLSAWSGIPDSFSWLVRMLTSATYRCHLPLFVAGCRVTSNQTSILEDRFLSFCFSVLFDNIGHYSLPMQRTTFHELCPLFKENLICFLMQGNAVDQIFVVNSLLLRAVQHRWVDIKSRFIPRIFQFFCKINVIQYYKDNSLFLFYELCHFGTWITTAIYSILFFVAISKFSFSIWFVSSDPVSLLPSIYTTLYQCCKIMSSSY